MEYRLECHRGGWKQDWEFMNSAGDISRIERGKLVRDFSIASSLEFDLYENGTYERGKI